MTVGLGILICIAALGLFLVVSGLCESGGYGAEARMGGAFLSFVGAAVLVLDFIAFLIWLAAK